MYILGLTCCYLVVLSYPLVDQDNKKVASYMVVSAVDGPSSHYLSSYPSSWASNNLSVRECNSLMLSKFNPRVSKV